MTETVNKSGGLIKAEQLIETIKNEFNLVIDKWSIRIGVLERKVAKLESIIVAATQTVNATNDTITAFFGEQGEGGQGLRDLLDEFKNMEVKGR